jgi:hypothetical protein
MGAKFKGVPYFKSLLRLKAPTARVQTTLRIFLRQCTLRLGRSAKFPPRGGGGGGGTNMLIARGL